MRDMSRREKAVSCHRNPNEGQKKFPLFPGVSMYFRIFPHLRGKKLGMEDGEMQNFQHSTLNAQGSTQTLKADGGPVWSGIVRFRSRTKGP